MHIPDGYLSPQTYVPMYAVAFAFWGIALRKIRSVTSAKYVPYLAMAAAFSFLVQMFNIPIPGGTTGHAVGAGIIALLLGPWTAVITVSVVLIIQALIFGDGGITAIGANSFNMAIVMPFAAYWTFVLFKGLSQNKAMVIVAAFFSGYVGLTAAAVSAAFMFGIQPLIAAGLDGMPLYAPYPLSIAIPAMAIEHLFVFSIVEGVMTAALLKYFLKNESGLIYAMKEASREEV